MKQFYIAWLAVSVIFISTDRLFSQDRTISTDTSWRYTYTSETDSTFRSRDLHTEIDSANIREIIRMSTEELDGDWQSGTKRRELYDSNGVLISVLDFSWDAVFGQWNENSLSEFYIDAYGSDTLIKLSTKSGDDWIVTMVFRTECTYDASGQLIQEIFINGPPGEEAAHRKQEYTLDASGNRIVTLRYNYDTDWVLFQKSETSYNEQGLILEDIIYSRSGENWLEQAKKVHAYNDDGKITVSEYHEWNAVSEEWAMTSRQEFTYNADWEWSLRTQYNYYLDGVHWGTNRDEYSYNLSGKLVLHASTMFNEETGQYISNQKTFYRHAGDYFVHYDTICNGEVYEWEGESFQAGGTYRKEYVSVSGLDSIYTLSLQENPAPASFVISGPAEVVQDQETLYIAPEDEALSYSWLVENGTIVSGAENDSLTVRWETMGSGEVAAWATNTHGCNSDTTSILVSIGTNGLEDLNGKALLLYPVPVNDVLRIKANYESLQLEVMDTSGRMVGHAEGLEIDLSHLDSGTYLVRLRDPDGILLGTRKILKE